MPGNSCSRLFTNWRTVLPGTWTRSFPPVKVCIRGGIQTSAITYLPVADADSVFIPKGFQNNARIHGQFFQPDSNGIVNGVAYGRHRRNNGHLTNTPHTVGV